MHLISGVCIAYYKFSGGTTFQTKRSADILTSRHSRTSSVPHVSSSLAKSHADPSMDHSRVLIQCVPSTEGVELQIRPTSPNWKLGSAQLNLMSLQVISGNCLSSSTKSAGMEVTRGNGYVHWTIHSMMIMSFTTRQGAAALLFQASG